MYIEYYNSDSTISHRGRVNESILDAIIWDIPFISLGNNEWRIDNHAWSFRLPSRFKHPTELFKF